MKLVVASPPYLRVSPEIKGSLVSSVSQVCRLEPRPWLAQDLVAICEQAGNSSLFVPAGAQRHTLAPVAQSAVFCYLRSSRLRPSHLGQGRRSKHLIDSLLDRVGNDVNLVGGDGERGREEDVVTNNAIGGALAKA